jgi:hypothetical protein
MTLFFISCKAMPVPNRRAVTNEFSTWVGRPVLTVDDVENTFDSILTGAKCGDFIEPANEALLLALPR